MPQVRLNKTPELEKVLTFFQRKYRLLSEAEIIKVALAEKYKKELGDTPFVDEETEKLIVQGRKDFKNGQYTIVKTDEELNTYLKSL